MKSLTLFLFLVLAGTACRTASAAVRYGVAIRALTGSSLMIATPTGQQRVQLGGIEIPPATEAAAMELSQRVIAGRDLMIEAGGYVYRTPDGLSLNAALLEAGVAIIEADELRAELVAAEKSARRREAGIWSRRGSAAWQAEYGAVRSLGIYVPFQPPPRENRSGERSRKTDSGKESAAESRKPKRDKAN